MVVNYEHASARQFPLDGLQRLPGPSVEKEVTAPALVGVRRILGRMACGRTFGRPRVNQPERGAVSIPHKGIQERANSQ